MRRRRQSVLAVRVWTTDSVTNGRIAFGFVMKMVL